jgi:hypothetical protein
MRAAPGKHKAPVAKLTRPPRTPDDVDASKGKPQHDVKVGPGKQAQFGLAAEVPAQARKGTAQVYRVVEYTGDRVTGGVTLVVDTR